MSSYGAKGTRTPNNRLQRTAATRPDAESETMGYVPDLHKIWIGTSDQQLMALSNEFPGFYRYASSWKRRPKPSATRHHRPTMAWPGSPRAQAAGGSTAGQGRKP